MTVLKQPAVPLATQIYEVNREIAQRDRDYPTMLQCKRLTHDAARLQQNHMRGVLRTLLWLERNEALIRQIAVHIEAIKNLPGVGEFLAEFPDAKITGFRKDGTA